MAKINPNDIKVGERRMLPDRARFKGDNFDINAQCDNCYRLYFDGGEQCNVPMRRGSPHTDWAAMNKIISLTQSYPDTDWTKHYERTGATLDGRSGGTNTVVHRMTTNTLINHPHANLDLDCPFYKAHPMWLPNWKWLKTAVRFWHIR